MKTVKMIAMKKGLLKFIVIFILQYTVLNIILLAISKIELDNVWKSIAMLCALIASYGAYKFFYTRTNLGKEIISNMLNER